MKREVSDERLQDYLDGRLSDAERAQIEARIGGDPALARRVAAAQEIGRALRAEAGELSPDFYIRARERFEQTTRGRPPWGFRLLSWEAAGLAAAVVLAAVLFLPEMTRHRDLSGPALRPAAGAADEPLAEKSTRPESPQRRDESGSDDTAGAAAQRETPWKGQASTDAGSLPVGGDGREASRAELRAEAVSEPAALASPPAPRSAPDVGGKAGDRAATVPPPGPGLPDPPARSPEARAEEAPRRSEREKKGMHFAVAPVESEAHARVVDPDASSTRGVDVSAVGLPADVAPADGIRTIGDRATWEALEGGPGAEALARFGGYDADRRLVLIGRTAGVDCAALVVFLDARSYRVRLLRAGDAAGCALLLPRDGLPIVLDAATGE